MSTNYTSGALIKTGNTKLKEKTDSCPQGAFTVLLKEWRITDVKNFLKGEDMFKI